MRILKVIKGHRVRDKGESEATMLGATLTPEHPQQGKPRQIYCLSLALFLIPVQLVSISIHLTESL